MTTPNEPTPQDICAADRTVVEVVLWNEQPIAVEATRRALEGIGGMLFEREGRWFVGTTNPGFIRFAAAQQGYVKEVVPDATDDR